MNSPSGSDTGPPEAPIFEVTEKWWRALKAETKYDDTRGANPSPSLMRPGGSSSSACHRGVSDEQSCQRRRCHSSDQPATKLGVSLQAAGYACTLFPC